MWTGTTHLEEPYRHQGQGVTAERHDIATARRVHSKFPCPDLDSFQERAQRRL